MLTIMDIEDTKTADAAKAKAKLTRRAEIMAKTGISFDPEPEQVVEVVEDRGARRRRVVVEVDPEEVERQKVAKLKEEDIAKYGVSLNV